eukprot:1201056-Pleurochrysis_carterae.AAC.1
MQSVPYAWLAVVSREISISTQFAACIAALPSVESLPTCRVNCAVAKLRHRSRARACVCTCGCARVCATEHLMFWKPWPAGWRCAVRAAVAVAPTILERVLAAPYSSISAA